MSLVLDEKESQDIQENQDTQEKESLDLQKKRQENLDAIKKFTLMDDTFMTQVFSGNTEATELILKVILQRDY